MAQNPQPPLTPQGGSGRSNRTRANLKANGGKGGGRRFALNRRWKKVAAAFAALCVLGVGILGGLTAFAWMTLPNLDEIGKNTGTIKILDSQGRLIEEVGLNGQQRHTVTIQQISPTMQKAMIAAEDRNFYTEGAFDLKRVLKALIVDTILRRPAQGASTLTQQLAKQAFFGADAERSPLRKLREALLANEIAGKYSKDQILEMYLNLTYFGENAYGIEDASQRYFGKDASQLNLPESAMLAGLPQAPSAYDPYQNPSLTWQRMHYVLQGMVTTGAITQDQADQVDPLYGDTATQQAHQQAIKNDLSNGHGTNSGPAPHFVQYVQNQLQQEFQDDPSALTGNLTVTTTLNLDYQKLADQVVPAGVAKLKGQGANNGALLMMDPNTGAILAMVGSADYNNNDIAGQYNIVTAMRRPGSSFKPYVYETGFKNGTLKPDTILQDTYAESQKLGGVNDFDHRYEGNITAASALVGSRNIATEQAAGMIGMSNIINFVHSLGVTSDIADNLSSAIGTSAIQMLQHTAAYSAFANGGHTVTPQAILKVTDDKGQVLVDHTQAAGGTQAMTPVEAWDITQILRGYAHKWNLHFKWDTAGKSGTTDNFVDAWYMVYTPSWVVGTWAGHTSGTNQAEVGMDQVYGTTEAAAIAVPFVNGLPKPAAFKPVAGALPDCATGEGFSNQSGCPTPTPSPTPSATPVPTQTPLPTPTVPVSPPLVGTPTATPKPTP